MKLNPKFKLVYEKKVDDSRTIYASEQNVPTENDGELDPNFNVLKDKDIKLVYEKDSKLFGSKESYPTKDDESATVTVNGDDLFVGNDGKIIINDANSLRQAIEAGGDVALPEDIKDVKNAIDITKATTLDLNGKEISGTVDTEGRVSLFQVMDGSLILKGEGEINVDAYCVNVGSKNQDKAASATIEGGKFKTQSASAVQVEKGNLTITGGEFETSYENANFLINVIDSERGNVKITITGGKFKGFDPSNPAGDPGMNFVADGYKAVQEDGWYVVKPNED